jgi:hypothetical protein
MSDPVQRNPPGDGSSVSSPPLSTFEDETTGFPLARSWRTVYVMVMASFALWIGLLYILMRAFS